LVQNAENNNYVKKMFTTSTKYDKIINNKKLKGKKK